MDENNRYNYVLPIRDPLQLYEYTQTERVYGKKIFHAN